jgi:CubicO group peptidase (beta-lactamase class C family)
MQYIININEHFRRIVKKLKTNQSYWKGLIILLFLVSCKDNGVESNFYTYQIPDQLDDGWSVSSLIAEGMDTGIIEEVTNQIINGEFRGIHSLAIVKNGSLVHEAYFEGYQRNSLHTIYSVTKSISSALIGIAIDQDLIQSVEESVFPFFPQYNIQDSNKQRIKLSHILTLTTGLDWDEKSFPYSDPRNTETQMIATNDWMKFVLERPIRSQPGIEWVYNTGSVHLLSGIIKQATGQFVDTFTELTLFQPLGIDEYEWNKDPQGFPTTGATQQGLRLKLRDIAKFGYLFLNKGKWKEQQVVSQAWVEESTSKHIDFGDGDGFG